MKDNESLLGQTFGELLVVQQLPEKKNRHTRWLCYCSCGGEREVTGIRLKNGQVTACTAHNKKIPFVRPLDSAGAIIMLNNPAYFPNFVQSLQIDDHIVTRSATFMKPWDVSIQKEYGYEGTSAIVIKCNWHGDPKDEGYATIALERINQALLEQQLEISGAHRVVVECPIHDRSAIHIPEQEFRKDMLHFIDNTNEIHKSFFGDLNNLEERMDALTEHLDGILNNQKILKEHLDALDKPSVSAFPKH